MDNSNLPSPLPDGSHKGPGPETGILVEDRSLETPEKGTPELFMKGLISALKEPLVLWLIILWVLLSGLRLWSSGFAEKAAGKSPGREMTIYGNFLYMNFFRDKAGAIGQESIDTIDRMTLDTFRGAVKESPGDEGLATRYGILLCHLQKTDEAEVFLKEKAGVFKDEKQKEILRDLYLDPEVSAFFSKSKDKAPRELSPEKMNRIKKTEESVKETLDGWFRDNALFRIYTLTGQSDRQKDLLKTAEGKSKSLLAGLFVVGMFLLAGFVVGPLFLAALVAATFTKYKNLSLTAKNVNFLTNVDYTGLTIKGTILVFLSWEYARFFMGVVNGYIFRGTRLIPPPALFISQLILYGSVILFMVHIIEKDGGVFKGVSIGLPSEGISKTALQILLGVAMYLAAVPVIIAGSMLYQMVFRQTPQSTNPVFDIIKGADTPMGKFLIFSVVGIMGPIFEEVLFRGYIYTACRRYMPALLAAPLVAMLFALIHFDMNVLFQLFLLGLLLGIIYERTGNLIPAIVTHCIWNSVVFFISITLLG